MSSSENPRSTCANLANPAYYCAYDNVGNQTKTDVIGAGTYTPTDTTATFKCIGGYYKDPLSTVYGKCRYQSTDASTQFFKGYEPDALTGETETGFGSLTSACQVSKCVPRTTER